MVDACIQPVHGAALADLTRLALVSPSGRLSISELAAHWQFADGSHFTRAFKKQYGQTPTEYARSAGAAPPSPNRRPPGRGAAGPRCARARGAATPTRWCGPGG
ncbi:helix-turn-helix domain-containing protein [Streptomyces erythrochromogenes]|uniref:helix-turn-helix domain-containing protein n=1 Tax=Streptomyces erythrochromogenes TaxID=285574 RepID=UPI00342BE906